MPSYDHTTVAEFANPNTSAFALPTHFHNFQHAHGNSQRSGRCRAGLYTADCVKGQVLGEENPHDPPTPFQSLLDRIPAKRVTETADQHSRSQFQLQQTNQRAANARLKANQRGLQAEIHRRCGRNGRPPTRL
jgi:hypothetical protein